MALLVIPNPIYIIIIIIKIYKVHKFTNNMQSVALYIQIKWIYVIYMQNFKMSLLSGYYWTWHCKKSSQFF